MNIWSRHDISVLFMLVIVGLVLRAQNLFSPFYYDEAVYVNLAQHPFHSDFYPDQIFFRHPPLHYLLLAALGSIAGYSEVVMRIPSLLFSTATIIFIYLVGRRLKTSATGLVAATLLTFNVLHQQYAQAATMYSLLAFWLTLSVYSMLSKNERGVAIGFLGAIYTHYFGFYLTPAVVLFYYHRHNCDWKKVAGKMALYILAYSPWIAIALQGLAFHALRFYALQMSGLRWWDFHWHNLFRQLSAILVVGMIYFSFIQRRQKLIQPVLVLCWFFLLSALFLIPFHRYLAPFLPILIALGVAGLAEWRTRIAERFQLHGKFFRAATWAVLFAGLSVPNIEAHGFYPIMGRHLDWRDAVHTQEWRRVVAAIPAGNVAASNIRSLLFYSNLQSLRQFRATQFNENLKEFSALIERAEHDWLVVPKYPLYAPLITLANSSNHYQSFAELDYTVIYRKVNAHKRN